MVFGLIFYELYVKQDHFPSFCISQKHTLAKKARKGFPANNLQEVTIMVVQHNLTAMNANRYLGINNSKLSKSLEKLSSGYAINRAGDNAAGLAVSEKMRSQIAGMTQAVKNAQDGISMVQTFEGALTETDSILQRMKTLADQMANGTYDDPVDRTAAQQEFLQLNDELDQIADTDFNGVVVLNGGVMADGTTATGVTVTTDANGIMTKKYNNTVDGAGLIDYKNSNNADAEAKAAKKAELQAQLNALTAPKAIAADTIDDVKYNKAAADKLWTDMGITTDDATEVTITFTATVDDTGATTWTATGSDVEGVDLSKITAAEAAKVTGATGKGGIVVSGANAGEVSNVIFDATKVNNGDVVAVKFTNTNDKTYAPKNVGFTDNSANDLDGKFTSKGDAKFVLDAALKDATMSADWKTVLDALSNYQVNVAYTAAATPGTAALTGTITEVAASDAGDLFTMDTDGTVKLTKAVGALATNTTIGKFTADTEVKQLSSYTTAGAVNAVYGIKVQNYSAADPTKVPDASLGTATPDTTAYEAKKKELQEELNALGFDVSVSDSFKNSEAKMTYKDSITLQAGARTKDAVNFTFQYASTAIGELNADLDCTANGLGTDKLTLSTQKDANKAIDKIDQAINKVSLVRGTFGAIQNRLEHKIDNLNVSVENLTSAESQIRDTNMPQEMMNFTKQQILAQASQSMLAQANQLPQGVLSLLQ